MGTHRIFPNARWLRRRRHKWTAKRTLRIAQVHAWMTKNRDDKTYGSAFDLAVDCVYTLDLVSENGVDGEPGNWEIPQYAVDIAESIMGPDNG